MATNSNNPRQVQSYSGQWNVQVVRGKVTTRCLWNACKALSIGLLLMTIGATMAIVGYYADQLSVRNEIRGNSTIRVKNESRGFHLNNLSYAGPIIMGIGGFIVVAACVMTFEARDSAAKVVPARFKPSMNSSVQMSSTKSTPHTLRNLQRLDSKINSSCQTPISKGSYKLSALGNGDRSPIIDPIERKLLTSAFVQFSRALMEDSLGERPRHNCRRVSDVNLNKSPSAPNLCAEDRVPLPVSQKTHNEESRSQRRGSPRVGGRLTKDSMRGLDRRTLLSPQLLQRQALSVDNPFFDNYGCYTPPSPSLCRQCSGRSGGSHESIQMELGASAGVSGSQASMALDLHDYQVTLKVKDESQSRRSDTSRRHQLLRQRPVEDEKDPCRCSCSFQMLPNMSDDPILARPDNLKLRYQSQRVLQREAAVSSMSFKSFSRSRSCTDDRKIYCIEDEKNISKEMKSQRCSFEQKHSPDRSPYRSGHRRADTCAVHGEAHQGLVRKNAKRRRSSQRMEGSLSNDGSGTPSFCRSPTLKSPGMSPSKTGTPANSFNKDDSEEVKEESIAVEEGPVVMDPS